MRPWGNSKSRNQKLTTDAFFIIPVISRRKSIRGQSTFWENQTWAPLTKTGKRWIMELEIKLGEIWARKDQGSAAWKISAVETSRFQNGAAPTRTSENHIGPGAPTGAQEVCRRRQTAANRHQDTPFWGVESRNIKIEKRDPRSNRRKLGDIGEAAEIKLEVWGLDFEK